METKTEQFNYIEWPHRDREGIQAAGNYKYMTDSLFVERAPDPTTALYTLQEHEVFKHGKWYPSAWMIYIHSTDEYDALRKLVGNVKHWEALKKTVWFKEVLEQWQLEHAYLQKMAVRNTALSVALSGAPGCTAAMRIVLGMIDENIQKRGRPKKQPDAPDHSAEIEADARRLLNAVPSVNN